MPEQNKRNWFNYEGFLIEEEELKPPPTVKCWVRGLTTTESFSSLELAVDAIKAAVKKVQENAVKLRPKPTPGWGPGKNGEVKDATGELDRRRKHESTKSSKADPITMFEPDSPEKPTNELGGQKH